MFRKSIQGIYVRTLIARNLELAGCSVTCQCYTNKNCQKTNKPEMNSGTERKVLMKASRNILCSIVFLFSAGNRFNSLNLMVLLMVIERCCLRYGDRQVVVVVWP